MIVMFLLGLFTVCCCEYVGKIYELEYYYHPPILFLFSFPFPFFILFFIFHFTLYQLPSMEPICHFIKYIHMRSCFEGFVKRNSMV
jgi:hypothetical protein